jgi:hypothetical protein
MAFLNFSSVLCTGVPILFKPPKWTLLLRTNMVSHFKTGKTDFGYLGPFENEAQKWQKKIGNTENKYSGMLISQFLVLILSIFSDFLKNVSYCSKIAKPKILKSKN